MHEGSVQAFSAGIGQGSEFVVRLPALAVLPPDSLSPRDIDRQPLICGKNRVLVVDDNIDNADSLAILLRLGGHDVCLAHDGHAALQIALEFRPEIVLLDIGLPGMDGYEVARRLRTQTSCEESILVAVTGYGRDEDRIRSADAGFDHHLVKPINFDALRSVFSTAGSRIPLRESSPHPVSAD
jgi:DNA-binding response OmpR family regulator